MHNLEVLGNTLLNWFNGNSMTANPGKYHLLLPGNEPSKTAVGNEKTPISKCEKRLGFKTDSHLNFKEHIESVCKSASRKIKALSTLKS